MTDHDEPTAYQGVAEMAGGPALLLEPWEAKQVSRETAHGAIARRLAALPEELCVMDTKALDHIASLLQRFAPGLLRSHVEPAPSRYFDVEWNREQEARRFAADRHAGQQYGSQPYLVHLEDVRWVLASFGYGGVFGVAAWLHDVLEDTRTAHVEVAQCFGYEVYLLVWAVTGVGKSRTDRLQSACKKIRQNPPAAILKLADRIANVEASRNRPEKLALYRSERVSFEAALAGLGDERMWRRLEAAYGDD